MGFPSFFLEALLSSTHFLGRAQWLENTEHTLGIWKIEMIISSQFWLVVVLNYVLHILKYGGLEIQKIRLESSGKSVC